MVGGRSAVRPTLAPVLSVVMPAHNEEGYLDAAVRDVVDGLRTAGRPFEVVVVENGSTDETAAVAAKLEDECPRCGP